MPDFCRHQKFTLILKIAGMISIKVKLYAVFIYYGSSINITVAHFNEKKNI